MGYYLHWGYEELMGMEHRERLRFCRETDRPAGAVEELRGRKVRAKSAEACRGMPVCGVLIRARSPGEGRLSAHRVHAVRLKERQKINIAVFRPLRKRCCGAFPGLPCRACGPGFETCVHDPVSCLPEAAARACGMFCRKKAHLFGKER